MSDHLNESRTPSPRQRYWAPRQTFEIILWYREVIAQTSITALHLQRFHTLEDSPTMIQRQRRSRQICPLAARLQQRQLTQCQGYEGMTRLREHFPKTRCGHSTSNTLQIMHRRRGH